MQNLLRIAALIGILLIVVLLLPEPDKTPTDSARNTVDLLGNPARWKVAADDYMGGASSAAINWVQTPASISLQVNGRLEPGHVFPYAGAMWFASNIPMQPEDYSGYARLLLHIDGTPGEYQALFFSGASQAAQPVPVPITVGQLNRIELGEVDGLDLTRLRAIGVFASGFARTVDFTIRAASIE